MVKRFAKIFGLIIAALILLLTPAIPVFTTGVSATLHALESSTEKYQHAAPANQTEDLFFMAELGNYDIANWGNTNHDNLIIQTNLDKDTHEKDYHKKQLYKDITISNGVFGTNKPTMLLPKTPAMPVCTTLTGSEIDLTANGYYRFSVTYVLTGSACAYFYLNTATDTNRITLIPTTTWRTASFYLHTASLDGVTVTPQLTLGDPEDTVGTKNGAVYFNKFTGDALAKEEYTTAVAKKAADEYEIDYTPSADDVKLFETYAITDFVANDMLDFNTDSKKSVDTSYMITHFGFDYFHTKDGYGNMMLLSAINNIANISLGEPDPDDPDAKKEFAPQPHETYMFQFYSITSADLSKFYFCIGDNYQTIETTSYQYYNGWQLNTVFFTADHKTDQKYRLSFSLNDKDNNLATGWVAIDDLYVYQVSGTYAANHSSSLGVHDNNDLNQDNASISNGYFTKGTAGAVSNASYPYPLKADSWETNSEKTNGIVNLKYWKFDFTHPGQLDNIDNNVYMLRNLYNPVKPEQTFDNTVTSPALNVISAQTTYFSFDACAYSEAPLTADFIWDDGSEEGIVLKSMRINANAWHHYEFAVTEDEYGTSRTYRLRFSLPNAGVAYIDNVRTASTAYHLASETTTIQTAIDLTNVFTNTKIWSKADTESTADFDAHAYNDFIEFENLEQNTVTIKHNFGWDLISGSYYRLEVTAYGLNAYLTMAGFDGYLKVNEKDALATTPVYTLYFVANDDTTAGNMLILLGSEDADTKVEANIHIEKITLISMEDSTGYDYAKEHQNVTTKVITPTNMEETAEPEEIDTAAENDFFGKNWWYLIPSLITALAAIMAVACFLFRKLKFDRHITLKTASYARDLNAKTNKNKIVAEKAAKVDNIKE